MSKKQGSQKFMVTKIISYLTKVYDLNKLHRTADITIIISYQAGG